MLVNTFAMSSLSYCSLVWNFSSAQSINKIHNLQKRALHFLLNGFGSTYEDLLEKSGLPNMNSRSQKTLCTEICKTLNLLNSGYMNDTFKLRYTSRLTGEKYKPNLENPKPNQATFGAT